ncbi:MAG TPA: hypothetical protein VFJ64_06600 [Solirubrobacterales bacterium]|nr:hypothetical protein [Solirubrobacterales bacterium]
MKPKMFVLAALAALMAMAFVGASSAMAESTELCGQDPGTGASAPCPNNTEAVTHVHETSVGKAILLASPKIECNVLFLGEVTPGNPLVTEGNFTYSSCGSGCTVTEEGGPSAIAVLRTGHETAKVTGEGEVHVNCIGINCYYNGEGLAGTAKGPLLATQKNGEVSIQEQTVNKTKGTFCPATGKLDITTTPLEATYIGKPGELHYCVEYEKITHGFYTNSTCTTLGNPRERNYRYMLVIGPANGWAVNEIKCFLQVPLLHKGLYSDSACTNDPNNDEEVYEKGAIKTIQ